MSVYRIREESVYGVHNMKNIIVIIGIFYSGSCIFMKEAGWNPNRTVMHGNSIYNGTMMSEGVL